jgi:hypothetical protein
MSIDLAQLNGIAGVTDAFIYSKSGQLLVPQLQYKDARIEQFGKEVALCSALFERMRRDVDFIELIYDDRHLIVQISPNFFILVICDDSADTTLIKLTLNVLSNEAQGDKEIQKSLRKLPAQTDLLIKAQEEPGLQELFKKLKITA